MTNKKRRKVVLSTPVILQVESRYPKPNKTKKMIWRTAVAITALAFILGGITTGEPKIIGGMALSGIVFGTCMLIALDKMHKSGEYPLVFTRSGISAGPYVNELWVDIKSYSLIEANDLGKFTLGKDGVGISLQLETKEARTDTKLGSIFPTLGYFFDENQRQKVRQIFAEFGTKCN
ncbi:hypothetical protein [Geomonas oryzae]|jgi:hypothetical protein|uniref:hypothetical protein n=1 Tax=Geomonas oryzae TaxID=2364273 RepID=UPI00100B379A|nr:hypothetical protein [Geomonas oryzae]